MFAFSLSFACSIFFIVHFQQTSQLVSELGVVAGIDFGVWKSRVMEELWVWKFLGQNFNLWKVEMCSLLVKQDLAVAIDGKAKKPSVVKDEDWVKTDDKEKATIFLSLSQNVLFNVHNESTTKKV